MRAIGAEPGQDEPADRGAADEPERRPDRLFVFQRGVGPSDERATEHVRREREPPGPGIVRYSWCLRGHKPGEGPKER
jgi:hypothetical protein